MFCSSQSKVCISFVKCILNCFILFVAIRDGIVFLISFLDGSLQVCGHTTGFCVLIMYPATLLKLFVVIFQKISQDFLHTRSCHLQQRYLLVLPLQSGFLLFLFSLLLPCGETGHHPSVSSDLRGITSNLHHLHDVICRFFVDIAILFICLRMFPSVSGLLSVFVMKGLRFRHVFLEIMCF